FHAVLDFSRPIINDWFRLQTTEIQNRVKLLAKCTAGNPDPTCYPCKTISNGSTYFYKK
ncbi:hypothetical protein L195_g045679, partial [Trifolium pratense]